jgi:hypothetical protein
MAPGCCCACSCCQAAHAPGVSAGARPSLFPGQLFAGHHFGVGPVRGLCAGLQGYYTLQRYGSSEAVGLLVALSLVRELGPVITALLFAGRAGTSLTAEIGLMKAGEQLSAMEMMAVDPVRRILAPRFWGGVIAMPLLAAVFSAVGILGGYVVAVLLIGIDDGCLLEPDAGWRGCLERCRQRRHQERCVRHCRDVHCPVAGLRGPTHAGRGVGPPRARWWCRHWRYLVWTSS